jgi:hypothetical protein
LKPWGSFESWSALIRNALVWLGEPDPVTTREELTEQADVELCALRGLFESWGEVDADGSGVSVAQLLTAIGTPGPRYERLRSALYDLVPTPGDKLPSARRVGMKLHHLRRRIVDGKALDRRDHRMGAIWFVREAK